MVVFHDGTTLSKGPPEILNAPRLAPGSIFFWENAAVSGIVA